MPNGSAPQQIAPGMHVQPGPMSYMVGTKMVPTPNGLTKFVVLHFETATGSVILPMDATFAKGIADAIVKAATGIEIVRPHG